MALDAGLSSLDTPFWQNHGQQNHFLTTIEHGGRCEKEQPKVCPKGEGVGTTESNDTDLHGWAEKRRAMLGQAKLALCFQIPSQASLHGILKAHRSLCCANGPALAPRSEIFGEKYGVALGLQAGMCCEKASASPLARVFSTTNPAFAQRINPVILVFLSVYIRAIRG